MRPLKRPMFKYGGDVKRQGIMHGMNGLREGGVATTMADATGYANGGSTTPPGEKQATFGAGNNANRDASGREKHYFFVPAVLGTAARMLAPRAIAAGARAFGRGVMTPKTPGQATGIMQKARNFFLPTGRFRQPATPKGYDAGFRKGQAPAPLTFKEIISSPFTLGRAARENPFTALGTLTLPNLAIKSASSVYGAAKGAGKMFIDAVLPGEQFKEKPEATLTKPKDGTRGSRLKTDGTEKVLSAAEKGEKDKERLNKIYKLLGVNRAQRNAAGKALIDVSRYIDETGKEAVTKKNIGSTITKAIGAFDKRLDKVDQLKEAAGLMMAKNYLEGGDRQLDRNLKTAKLNALRKEADPSISNLKAVYKKAGVNDAAGAAATEKFGSAYGGSIMSTKDFNKQMKEFEGQQIEEKTILDIATNAVKNLEMASEGAFVDNGYYKVGENIVLIEGGVAKSIVG